MQFQLPSFPRFMGFLVEMAMLRQLSQATGSVVTVYCPWCATRVNVGDVAVFLPFGLSQELILAPIQ